tara:strand:- start:621 stop:830 length:210 start_codon:yes stop_codon:yes gene_type:complete
VIDLAKRASEASHSTTQLTIQTMLAQDEDFAEGIIGDMRAFAKHGRDFKADLKKTKPDVERGDIFEDNL